MNGGARLQTLSCCDPGCLSRLRGGLVCSPTPLPATAQRAFLCQACEFTWLQEPSECSRPCTQPGCHTTAPGCTGGPCLAPGQSSSPLLPFRLHSSQHQLTPFPGRCLVSFACHFVLTLSRHSTTVETGSPALKGLAGTLLDRQEAGAERWIQGSSPRSSCEGSRTGAQAFGRPGEGGVWR